MAGLEAVLRIRAEDDTAKALEAIKAKIAGIEKTAGQMDKFVSAVGKVTRSTDPLASSLAATEKALASQRSEISAVVGALDRITGPTDRAAAAQRNLARSVQLTTGAFEKQGSAARGAARAAGAHGGGGGGGGHHGVLGAIPFAGPIIEHGAEKLAEAGASVEQEIARLKAMGASMAEIDKARSDWRGLSKQYAGMTENDYLANYRGARTQAPDEPYEMAAYGAKYQLALRNSGLSSSEHDVENVIKIMDEMGLKNSAQREDFINQMVKTQQTFGGSITPETMLAAYRNAKQAVYGWSPQFRNSYLPTLLQSSGEQGGTEVMTAYNNWVGHHMTHAELKAMAAAGFVRNSDLMYNKTGDIKGVKPGAHMYGEDQLKSDPAAFSWGFHDEFMKRKGATEGKFENLIATLPRNMAALISFFVHNEGRFKRDAETRDKSLGSATAGNEFLAQNPTAGLAALQQSIEAFSGVVSEPAMKLIGKGLEEMASGIQRMSGVYGDWAKANPKAAEAAGVGAMGSLAAAGGYLSLKLMTGIGRLFGFGSGAASAGGEAAAAGGAAAGGGWLAGGPLAALVGVGYELGNPDSFIRKWMAKNINSHPGVQVSDDWATTKEWRLDRAKRDLELSHPMMGIVGRDMEGARGRAMMGLAEQHGPIEVNSTVSGQATVTTNIVVTASSELLSVFDAAKHIITQIPLNPLATGHSGAMNSDAAPLGRGGTWDR